MGYLSLKLEEYVNRSEWITLMCPKANTFISYARLPHLYFMENATYDSSLYRAMAICYFYKKRKKTLYADLPLAIRGKNIQLATGFHVEMQISMM